jgi:hypothetical protein
MIAEKLKGYESWMAPEVPENIPHGDMPGDKVRITESHIQKAGTIFPALLKKLIPVMEKNPWERVVVCVCGGSGVGKSEIASLLSWYFCCLGIGSYTLSGDNYPHRIPKYNDAERLRIFRESALKGMVASGDYSMERLERIRQWQRADDDANADHAKEYPWFASYLEAGRKGLAGYLGTDRELEFEDLEAVVSAFKSGEKRIWLKRMGRAEDELWYEQVDFSGINILIIEWTHGNSGRYRGVDLPILLNSTPQETLAHRKARNRDGAADSPFTTMVLEIEQKLLESEAHKAAVILSKSGELLSYAAYQEQMKEG